MTEQLSEGAERAAQRIEKRVKTSQDEYVDALYALVDFVGEHAREGDRRAIELLKAVQAAQTNKLAEGILIREEFGL